ncbi:MAG: hypothetical protein LQ338_006562 [Usnochroma carphineum]|nr:MAG: hypothetical protein LQ338_006562 [Usnochroma carphineum]
MKSLSGHYAFFLAVIYPMAASSQHHPHNGGSPPQGFPGLNPPATQPAVAATVATTQDTAAATTPPVASSSNPVVIDSQPGGNSNPTTSAVEPVSTGGGGGGGGGNCAAVAGNMNVQLSGASVAFRFEPPVAGNPTTGNTGSCKVWTFPPGWSGRVHVGGGSGAPFGSTLYEGNVNPTGGSGAMDVSFIEGFSVPMICTDNGNGFESGCGIDLFTQGHTCPTGGSKGGVCKNPQGPGGARDSAKKACYACSPPDPFFGPCSAAAFTFPTDDAANDGVASLDISCHIGASSQRTGREGHTAKTGQPEAGRCQVCADGSKRDLEAILFGRGLESTVARAPSMLPRVHRRSVIDVLGRRSHRHGAVAHEGKVR